MVCQFCYIVGGKSEVAYMRLMMGVRPSFWYPHQERIWSLECKVKLAARLLESHSQVHYEEEGIS